MAEPLDLESLGTPGNRRSVRVAETVELVRPFTEGRADLEIGPNGSVFPVAKTRENKNATETLPGDDAAADAYFRSRIGRRFRSF